MVAEGGDAAKGSGIEVYSTDNSVQSTEKHFHLHFSVIRMGSLDTFMLLKTRKLHFQTI